MGSSRQSFLNSKINEHIMTCGELKTLEFNILDSNLNSLKDNITSSNNLNYTDAESFKNNINNISIYKNTKKGNKEIENSRVEYNVKEKIKIKPGSRIIKIETIEDYKELIERYVVKSEWKSEVGHDLTQVDFLKLSKDYEGIYMSKEVSAFMNNEINKHSTYENEDKNKISSSSRIIILDEKILSKDNKESYRSGVSGKIYKLSEYNKKFSQEVFNNIGNYTKMITFFKNKQIRFRDVQIKTIKKTFFNKTYERYYLKNKNITNKINKLNEKYKNINNNLNEYGGDIHTFMNGGSNGNIVNKYIRMSIAEQFAFYEQYMSFNLNYNTPTIKDKLKLYFNKNKIFNDITESVLLHELGHVNNNNVKRKYDVYNAIKSNIITDNINNKYYIEKKYALAYMQEQLHRERLAWDYAFRIKPDCEITKWVSHYAYSAYVSNHMRMKKSGYINFSINQSDTVKLYFI